MKGILIVLGVLAALAWTAVAYETGAKHTTGPYQPEQREAERIQRNIDWMRSAGQDRDPDRYWKQDVEQQLHRLEYERRNP